jgi:D-galactarolactone isomerase
MAPPLLRVPPGACDCHMHIYEESYPLVPQAMFKPPHAPPADYLQVQRALGLSRAVVVQPNGYGFDNRCTLAALSTFGASARAVATVPVDVTEGELERLTSAGVRGARFHLLPGGMLTWDALAPLAARIAPYGWHLQLQLDGRELPRYEAALARLSVPLVIDHNGKFLEPVAIDHPAFRTLLRLIAAGNTWVKLSAPYETSRLGPPRYADVGALATALVQANPGRCVWASNWPHPGRDPRPDSAALLELLREWAPEEATRQRILVDNPAALYGF